jgi:dsRNA-specific ribonuclease
VREEGSGWGMSGIEFQPFEIESNIKILLEEIVILRENTPLKQTHQLKFDIWIQDLTLILDQISKIDKIVLPLIKKDLDYPFSDKNLIVAAMVQPSLKKPFNGIKDHFYCKPGFEKIEDIVTKLGSSPDTAKSLAWIGDTAIKFAILQNIWRPGITPEDLHNKRQSLENNKNLSILCDKWKLFEYRIDFDHPAAQQKKMDKIKGSLVEAIFGVIFIEREIDGVEKALHQIDRSIK